MEMNILEKIALLRSEATPGTWGPTTSAPQGLDQGEFHLVKDGERGEPTWSAIVSDQDGIPGIDHKRYADDDPAAWYYEPGTDIYGGTLIAESINNPANGAYITELHNNFPQIMKAIEALHYALRLATSKQTADSVLYAALYPQGMTSE